MSAERSRSRASSARRGCPVAASADDRVSAVLLGYDTELTYQKLEDCCILARARRGLHRDASGHGLPDVVWQRAGLRQLH